MAKETKKAAAKKPAAVKKTTTKSAASKTKSTAVKKATTKSRKHAAPASGGAAPMVDTSFAAEAAARMLTARAKMGNVQASAGGEEQRESGMFKQMKESINKPAAGGLSTAMGNTFGPNKTNLPNPDKGHVVRDQTTSNVNRVNVPRRTGG